MWEVALCLKDFYYFKTAPIKLMASASSLSKKEQAIQKKPISNLGHGFDQLLYLVFETAIKTIYTFYLFITIIIYK